MVSIEELFEKSFSNMISHIDNLKTCSNIATSLADLSIMHENKDGVMIAEILAGTFYNIHMITLDFNVNHDDLNELKKDFIHNIQLLSTSFKEGNFKEVYVNLKNISYGGYKFQYTAFQTLSERGSQRVS